MRPVVRTIGVSALLVLALASTAHGRAGNLQVTQANRIVSAQWSLQPGDLALTFWLSLDPSFENQGVTLLRSLSADQTSTDWPELLPGGTYYARVQTTPNPTPCDLDTPGCVIEYSDIGSVVVPSQAANLHTVTQVGGVVSATWSLPPGVGSWWAEISRSAARDFFGFVTPIDRIDVELNQTSFTFPTLPPGDYYVQIKTTPTQNACLVGAFEPGCVFELSNVFLVRPGNPAPTGAGGPPGSSAADKIVALGAITAASRQDVDKLGITLNPGEAVKAKLSGSVNVPGASKVYRFKTINKSVGGGKKTRLSLRLASKAKRAVKHALRRKKRLKAKLTLVVTDNAGNAQTKKYSVRLKR